MPCYCNHRVVFRAPYQTFLPVKRCFLWIYLINCLLTLSKFVTLTNKKPTVWMNSWTTRWRCRPVTLLMLKVCSSSWEGMEYVSCPYTPLSGSRAVTRTTERPAGWFSLTRASYWCCSMTGLCLLADTISTRTRQKLVYTPSDTEIFRVCVESSVNLCRFTTVKMPETMYVQGY